MDALGLFFGFIDGEDEAAVHEFFVDVDGSGGEEDHDGTFDVVLLGFHASGLRIFSGGGDGEFAFGLQEFEGVARFFGSFVFHDGKDLVLEIGLAEVVEGLACHGGVFDLFFFGEELEDGFHEGAFACGTGALDDDGERFGELARDAGEVGGEFVGALADYSAGVEGLRDVV